jgi:ribonuclease HII
MADVDVGIEEGLENIDNIEEDILDDSKSKLNRKAKRIVKETIEKEKEAALLTQKEEFEAILQTQEQDFDTTLEAYKQTISELKEEINTNLILSSDPKINQSIQNESKIELDMST